MSDTPEVVYLEGIYVAPDMRGKGYGLRCLSQLNRSLLARAQSVCFFVNESNQAAFNFYVRAGFKQRGHLETFFFNERKGLRPLSEVAPPWVTNVKSPSFGLTE